MKTLALETSGRRGSVAAYASEKCLAAVELPQNVRTAESLITSIQDLVKQCGWTTADLELIAVTQGPGSFTGLRLGCVTAKVLAYAIGAELVGINTLEAIAHNVEPGTPLWCAMDAGRDQCFVARYTITQQERIPTVRCQTMNIEHWLERLERDDRIAGPLLHNISAPLPTGVQPLPSESWLPHARGVALLGMQKAQQGLKDSLWEFSPHYYRLSAAEEKQAAAEGPQRTTP